MTGEILNFFGNSYDDEAVEGVYVKIDNNEIIKAKGTATWSFALPTINLKSGLHKLEIYAREKNDSGKEILSNKITRNFYFDESGPIVRVESHINGMPVGHRPWLLGKTGYYIKDLELKLKKQIQEIKYENFKQKFKRNPELVPKIETIPVKSSEVNSLKQKISQKNKIQKIFMSYDNGKTYIKNTNVAIPPKWKIRLQTQNLEEGNHMLQIKAITLNNEERIEYFKVILDKSIPTVIIDKPNENTDLNEKIVIRGSTNDNGNVEEVQVALKRFDKNLGNLPKFVQGIYLWVQAFGGPWISGGFGLTFFEDIVRLEGLFGWIPTYENIRDMGQDPETTGEGLLRTVTNEPGYDPRFSGFVTGGKLLARVIDIPFEFFWGEDAKNFSISAEIGCGFYWYSGYGSATNEKNNEYYYLKRPDFYDGYQPAKDGKFLAGFMYQIDYFKVQRYGPFRKFALYFEHSFLFIASEIEGGLIMQFGFGMRNAIF